MDLGVKNGSGSLERVWEEEIIWEKVTCAAGKIFLFPKEMVCSLRKVMCFFRNSRSASLANFISCNLQLLGMSFSCPLFAS